MKDMLGWSGGRRKGLLVGCFLVSVIIGMAYGWLMEVLIVAALFLSISRTRLRTAVIPGILTCLYILSWGVWLVSDRMTGVGINQAVIYHLFSGIQGADYSQFLPEFALAMGFLALSIWTLAYSIKIAWKGTRRDGRMASYRYLILGSLAVVTGWLLSPWHHDIVMLSQSYAMLDGETGRRIHNQYHIESREIHRKRNLVVLYLESFESTYFNETIFPDLLPHLNVRREASRYFSGIDQGPGAGWTIAGLVSSQCGIPLVTPGSGINDMGNVQRFLPEAKCLAELLVENGYHTVYIGGASGEFAGKDNFLTQHGFQEVRDIDYFENKLDLPESVFSGWGVYDDQLLKSVYDEFMSLSQQEQPFALFALTIDTHHPHGYISPSCNGLHYGNGKIKTLNALHCADRLVSRFIDNIVNSPYYADTTLVVMSDHLAMINDAHELISKAEERENLLMIFDPQLAAGEQQIEATTLDIGATLLDVLDAEDTRLGFGRSLLDTSLHESAYSATYQRTNNVTDYLSFSRELWSMPNLAGIITSDGNGHVRIGESLLSAPFLSVLDSQNNLVEVYFRDFPQHIEGLKQGTRYIYALTCQRSIASGLCLVSANKGISERTFTHSELISGVRAADIF